MYDKIENGKITKSANSLSKEQLGRFVSFKDGITPDEFEGWHKRKIKRGAVPDGKVFDKKETVVEGGKPVETIIFRDKTTAELKIDTLTDLKNSDTNDLPRILEDILALLVADGLDTTRLPKEAQEKLLKRKKLREKL